MKRDLWRVVFNRWKFIPPFTLNVFTGFLSFNFTLIYFKWFRDKIWEWQQHCMASYSDDGNNNKISSTFNRILPFISYLIQVLLLRVHSMFLALYHLVSIWKCSRRPELERYFYTNLKTFSIGYVWIHFYVSSNSRRCNCPHNLD